MRKAIHTALPAAFVAAVGLALAPASAHAQAQAQKPAAQEGCTAQLTPAAVAPGQKAVEVVAALSTDVGAVNEVKAQEGSGVALAQPDNLPKSQMSRSDKGDAPEAIEMAKRGNSATLWLSTADASPGEHSIVLKGEKGQCTAKLSIEKPGMDEGS